jgi:hypothetical protein
MGLYPKRRYFFPEVIADTLFWVWSPFRRWPRTTKSGPLWPTTPKPIRLQRRNGVRLLEPMSRQDARLEQHNEGRLIPDRRWSLPQTYHGGSRAPGKPPQLDQGNVQFNQHSA